MTNTTEVHMGELIDLVEQLLAKRGLKPTSPIRFRYLTSRAQPDGCMTLLNESAAYLTAFCETTEKEGG